MRCFFFLGIDLEWSKFFLSVFDFKFVLLQIWIGNLLKFSGLKIFRQNFYFKVVMYWECYRSLEEVNINFYQGNLF